eukprot:5265446-Ditylum_brightwellii.AAC.1
MVWQCFLLQLCSQQYCLRQHLGNWYTVSYSSVTWWYFHMDYCLYCQHNEQERTTYASRLGDHAHPGITFYLEVLDPPPPSMEQANVKVFHSNMIIFE